MKIDRITTFLVDAGRWRNFVFVRIDTDGGVAGWGESFAEAGREVAVAAEVAAFGRRIIGRDPFEIRRLTSELQTETAGKLRSLEFCSAVSGMEIALWDVLGKALGQPVHRLLGGAHRDRVRLYANCHDGKVSTPEGWADVCAAAAKRGFGGVKLYPVARPIESRRDEDEVVATVAAVREAVGPDVDVMVDCARLLTAATAIRLVDRLAEFNPFWFEEPVPADNLDALAEIRAHSPVPLLTGETLYTRTQYRDLFARRAVDIVNPDVCNTGGILELTQIAAWAEPNQVMVTPHNWNSLAVGLAATLQASACVRDLLYVEYLLEWEVRSNELLAEPLQVIDGTMRIPGGPGLGVEMDERAMARYPVQEYNRLWPD